MKYLTFIRCSESYRDSPPPAALNEAMGAFVEKSLKDGTLVDTGGLLPSKDGLQSPNFCSHHRQREPSIIRTVRVKIDPEELEQFVQLVPDELDVSTRQSLLDSGQHGRSVLFDLVHHSV